MLNTNSFVVVISALLYGICIVRLGSIFQLIHKVHQSICNVCNVKKLKLHFYGKQKCFLNRKFNFAYVDVTLKNSYKSFISKFIYIYYAWEVCLLFILYPFKQFDLANRKCSCWQTKQKKNKNKHGVMYKQNII
jgi:hypothetical protein